MDGSMGATQGDEETVHDEEDVGVGRREAGWAVEDEDDEAGSRA